MNFRESYAKPHGRFLSVDFRGTPLDPAKLRVLVRSRRAGVRVKSLRYHLMQTDMVMLKAATAEVSKAIILAIDTGLRREELFSLRWNQIDLVRGIITTTKKTKSGRPRSVPLPERSCGILPPFPGVDDFVLINPETKKRYVQMNKGCKAAVRRAGIEDVQWHDLRRTAGCRWLQRDGKSMEEVSILLGHSSVQVTEQRYAFLESEKVAASISGRTKTGTVVA